MISRIRHGSSPAFQNVCHWLRGLKTRSPGPGLDDVVAEQRAHPALEDVAVLVLARVAVQRRGERARRHRVLDEREAAAGLVAVDHEPDADAAEEARLAVLRADHLRCRRLPSSVSFHRTVVSREILQDDRPVCQYSVDSHDRSKAPIPDEAPRRARGGRRGGASPRAPSRCTGRSARRARRSARSPSTPACAARPSTATSPTRPRCSPRAARTGWRRTRRPTSTAWAAIEDPGRAPAQSRSSELYAYYRRTEGMLRNLLRDEATVPTVRQRFQGFHDYLDRRPRHAHGRPARTGPRAPASARRRSATRSRSRPGTRWRASRSSTTRRPPT